MATRGQVVERRAHERRSVQLEAKVVGPGTVLRGKTVNISPAGVRVRLPLPFDLRLQGAVRAVVISGIGHFDCRLVWTSGFDLGLQFLDGRRAAVLLAPLLAGRPAGAAPPRPGR